MPYYKEANILFIHIPKTGGTIIENEINTVYNQTLYNTSFTNELLEHPYDKISLQHQFYSTIYKYKDVLDVDFNKNLKIFAFVRNPYSRVISDLFWHNLIDKDFTPEKVYDIIKNNYIHRHDLDNHNKPQYKFITDEKMKIIPSIKIFKCEKLKEMDDDIKNFLEFDMNIIQKNVNKDYSKYLNRDSVALINNFYRKDFELFNYKLINPSRIVPKVQNMSLNFRLKK